jgi:hypothetical protein
MAWAVALGMMDDTVETLPSPAARLGCNPALSGNDGGRDCHPRWLAVDELELQRIGAVVWATGYRPDFSWLEAPVDELGWPVQVRGISLPGLYYVGLHWLHKRKSGLLLGVGEDAEYVVSHLRQRT